MTSRPTLEFRAESALRKAKRGFTVEAETAHPYLVTSKVQARHEERRRKDKWRYRYQVARGTRAVWSPWLPLLLDGEMLDVAWRVVR